MKAYRIQTLGGITKALHEAGKLCSEFLKAGKVPVIEVREDSRKRTTDQNAKIHAMIGDIAKQTTLNGCKYNAHVWKRLTTAEFLKDRGERPMLIQDISGDVLVLWERTSKMSTKTMADYIEWLYAYGESEGVKWTEPRKAA